MTGSTRRIVRLVVSALLLAGCRSVQPVSDIALSSDGILVEMWGSKDCVAVGDTVRLRATATNRGTEPFAVDLHDRPVLDIVVASQRAILQRWSDGKPLTSDVTGLALQPGQSKTLEMDWVPATSVYGPVRAWANYIHRFSWGDDPLIVSILIEVQTCSGPLP